MGILVVVLGVFVQAKTVKNCEESPSFLIQLVKGEKSSQEAKTEQGTVKVGGAEDQMPEGLDRLAVQRALLSCTPGMLKCHRANPKQPKKLRVSFSLSPSGEAASGGDWIFSSKEKLASGYTQCLNKVFSETKFVLSVSKAAQVVTSLEFQ